MSSSPRWPQVLGASFLDRLQNQDAPPQCGAIEVSPLEISDRTATLGTNIRICVLPTKQDATFGAGVYCPPSLQSTARGEPALSYR